MQMPTSYTYDGEVVETMPTSPQQQQEQQLDGHQETTRAKSKFRRGIAILQLCIGCISIALSIKLIHTVITHHPEDEQLWWLRKRKDNQDIKLIYSFPGICCGIPLVIIAIFEIRGKSSVCAWLLSATLMLVLTIMSVLAAADPVFDSALRDELLSINIGLTILGFFATILCIWNASNTWRSAPKDQDNMRSRIRAYNRQQRLQNTEDSTVSFYVETTQRFKDSRTTSPSNDNPPLYNELFDTSQPTTSGFSTEMTQAHANSRNASADTNPPLYRDLFSNKIF